MNIKLHIKVKGIKDGFTCYIDALSSCLLDIEENYDVCITEYDGFVSLYFEREDKGYEFEFPYRHSRIDFSHCNKLLIWQNDVIDNTIAKGITVNMSGTSKRQHQK